MAPTPQTNLTRLLRTMGVTEVELRQALRAAARDSRDIVLRLDDGLPTFSRQVRTAQTLLAQQQIELWASNEGIIRAGVERAGVASADLSVLWSGDLLRTAGVPMQEWKEGLRRSAQAGVRRYLARAHNGFTLSARVFRNRALTTNAVGQAVNNGLLLGKSAKEIADDVYKYIHPGTPGGASYAAMRLGRTELNNAFHELSRSDMAATPWTEAVQWNLSGSHPRPDVCDDYANDVHIRNGEPGHYRPDDVPDKPHPQCFCFVTPVQVSDEQFIANFHAGVYDSYINSVIPTQAGQVA